MKFENNNITIFEALKNVENAKYVMPAFQRQYVWDLHQIEKLWDSILLDYPIATFLFWHINENNASSDTYFCNFLNNAQFNSRKSSDSLNFDLITIDPKQTSIAVLDGQQRLTSLFISLIGGVKIRAKHSRKNSPEYSWTELYIELDKNKIETEEKLNSKSFDIRFSDKIGRQSPTQFKIKEILSERFTNEKTRESAIEDSLKHVPANSKEYARNIITKIYNKIFVEQMIHFTQINDMKQDDALEMFVRFNSGGKALKKSEITMSILEAYWPSAKTKFEKVLKDDFEGFGTDFIIRAALMLYGDVSKSDMNETIVNELKNNWEDFSRALLNMSEMIKSFKIEFGRFKASWNVLLPILYCVYFNFEYKKDERALKSYLVRAIIFNLFQSGTTQRLAMMKSNLNNYNFEMTIEMLEQISELKITDAKIEDLLDKEKESRITKELLYYLSLEHLNSNFEYDVDHLHPHTRFDATKPPLIPQEKWMKLRTVRNKIPNLHLLEAGENRSKNDMRLIDYYNDMIEESQQKFLAKSLIPSDSSLEFEDFENFYNKRKQMLADKIKEVLS